MQSLHHDHQAPRTAHQPASGQRMTLSFIATSAPRLPFRPRSRPTRCTLNPRPILRVPTRYSPSHMQARSPNDEMDDPVSSHDDEDDDATLGTAGDTGTGPASSYGMPAPPLSPSDRIYLNGARDNAEYMTRMTEIARRLELENERKRQGHQRQSPDDYIDALSKSRTAPADAEYGSPRVDATDAYMEALARQYRKDRGIIDPPLPEVQRSTTTPPGPTGEPANLNIDSSFGIQSHDSLNEVDGKMRALEAEIQHVSQSLASDPDGDVAATVAERLQELQRERENDDLVEEEEHVSPISLEDGAKKIAELQRQIRGAAGVHTEPLDTPESSPPVAQNGEQTSSTQGDNAVSRHVGKDPATVDKQIQFLEHYLSKLEREAGEGDAAPEKDDEETSDPNFELSQEMQNTLNTVAEHMAKIPGRKPTYEGLEDSPGEMTAADKMAIFEMLRRRAANANPTEEFADPLNTSLPERPTAKQYDEDDGDEPSPESAREYDSFAESSPDKALLIEEIETEIKAYSRDVKALLQRHETRLQILITRLAVL